MEATYCSSQRSSQRLDHMISSWRSMLQDMDGVPWRILPVAVHRHEIKVSTNWNMKYTTCQFSTLSDQAEQIPCKLETWYLDRPLQRIISFAVVYVCIAVVYVSPFQLLPEPPPPSTPAAVPHRNCLFLYEHLTQVQHPHRYLVDRTKLHDNNVMKLRKHTQIQNEIRT